jgi:predicted nucleotidyltransferase component of viral defense system
MHKFLALPNENRQELFLETARKLGVLPVIIEKDFWVCWVLQQIFSIDSLKQHLTFKGGTSLSKAYQLIDRFSEDVDLTISRTAPHLADIADPMEANISGKERERRIDALKNSAQRFVADVAQPALHKHFQQTLGAGEHWRISLDEEDHDKQTLLFFYPATFGDGYIKSSVKLEFGARGEIEPSEEKPVSPYVAEAFPQFFDSTHCNVHVLAAERTFWEKATILHALHHGTKMRDRMSRHYYDTYILAQKGVADKALQNVALLAQVVRNKSLMFADNKASYETAVIGSLRLMPKPEMLPELKRDYAAMEPMFMKAAPDFEAMMQAIAQLEKQANT